MASCYGNRFGRVILVDFVTIMSTSKVDPKVIESIPLAVLKTMPAASPPPGIQPNFADPPTRVPVILGVSIAFFVLAIFCFSIRIYTKLAVVKNWKWDDCEWHLCRPGRWSRSQD